MKLRWLDYQEKCEHEWEWHIDLNGEVYGICKKCKAVNDDYRTPEIMI